MKMIRAITPKTIDNLLLGAGAFYKNFNPNSDTPETAKAKLLGATDGGGTFAVTSETRQISIDGLPGPVKGYEQNDGVTATMTINTKEVTVDNITLALGSATATSMTTISATKITGKPYIEDSDYVDNITWAGTLSGTDEPVYIVLKNALSLNGLNLTVADKAEAVLPITLTAHYDVNDLENPPYEIIYPNRQ